MNKELWEITIHAIRGNSEEIAIDTTYGTRNYYSVMFSLVMAGYTEIEIIEF